MTECRGAWAVVAAALCAAPLAGCAESTTDESLPAMNSAAQVLIPHLEVVVETSDDDPVAATVDAATVEPVVDVAAEPPSAPEVVQSLPVTPVTPIEPAEPAAPPVDAAAYEPPFPDRIDLFVAPKREGGATAGAGTTDYAVELMGFVRVGTLKAVLAINGEVAPMAVGESRFGIDVISIHPPNVMLQRGRQRWQATLE